MHNISCFEIFRHSFASIRKHFFKIFFSKLKHISQNTLFLFIDYKFFVNNLYILIDDSWQKKEIWIFY